MGNIEKLEIEGAFRVPRTVNHDTRGFFSEEFRRSEVSRQTGIDFTVAQMNLSTSDKGAMRGLHVSQDPVRTQKLLAVRKGRILDIIVDLRRNSSSFGQFQLIEIDSSSGFSLLLSHFIGHGFLALEPGTQVTYSTTNEYAPESEVSINLFSLGVDWQLIFESNNLEKPILSHRDENAVDLGSFEGIK